MFGKIKSFLKKTSTYILFIPFLFLAIGIMTISDYGVNWDSFVHYSRGQAYLQYFLTGEENYNSLPAYENSECVDGNLRLFSIPFLDYLEGGDKCSFLGVSRRSYFQSDYYNYEYYIENDSGHPPLNDILAALTNYVFYQKLGIIEDIASHHIFIIVTSFALVLAVALFVMSELGPFPAIVSSIILASYPLFFSESHFNIKDPPEAAFFGLTLIFFYLGVVKNNWKYIIASAIAAGLALGTKLNIVFAVLIVGPWLIYYVASKLFPKFSLKKLKKFIAERRLLGISLILFLPICFGIVYALWPYLWQNPRNIFNILEYYTQIGVGIPADLLGHVFLGWNFYPIYWIFVTTPIPVLVLSIFGVAFLFSSKKYNKFGLSFFVFLWLLVPIARVSWPNSDIYGGVRQIMEYVPALAILAGLGTYFVIERVKKTRRKSLNLVYLAIIFGLVFSTYEMVKIHPNENIYFNQLVGGLKGAAKKNIPYWGNTYGTAYIEGIRWINENAESGAKVTLPLGIMSNIPRIMLRSDLDYSKYNWTGPNKGGEYGIEMYFEWSAKYWYSFQYYDRYLIPVYEYLVDGIPVLKIWKNDLAHTKPEFKEEIVYEPKSVVFNKNTLNSQLKIDLGKEMLLTRFSIKHSNLNCQKQVNGYIVLSSDGEAWKQEVEPIILPQHRLGVNKRIIGWDENNFIYLFAGKKARYIILDPQMDNSCYLKNPQVEIRGLKVLP